MRRLHLAPLPAAPGSSRTATSASWKKQHNEEGRRAQPIALRFARHTCRTAAAALRGGGRHASRKATRQFSKATRWTGISHPAAALNLLSLSQTMALGGYLPAECCLFSTRGSGATRTKARQVPHGPDRLQGRGTDRAVWSTSHNTPGLGRNSSTGTAGLPKTSSKPHTYSLFGDEFETAMPDW